MDENDFGEDEWAMMADEAGPYEVEVDEWMKTAAENGTYDGSMWSSFATTPDSDDFRVTRVEKNVSGDFKPASDNIARVERLRLDFSQLMSRKNIAMDMLIDLLEKDVVRLT